MFGAGGATSSYEELEHTGVIVLWGSNARETHPVLFHHVLRGVRNGAKLFVIDPRRTASARWACSWLSPDVGSDVALANALGREIVERGIQNAAFIERATVGFDSYRKSVEPYTLAHAEHLTGVPAAQIRELARAYASASGAQLCWTLGVTEHHNGTDAVRALINLALLTGQVGRYGSGLVPLRGQNNVQGSGDMGALPNVYPSGQSVEDPQIRAQFERAWGASLPATGGLNLSQMFDAAERGELDTLYVVGENPAQSEPDQLRATKILSGLEGLIVQDLFLTKTAQMANVVLPASAAWCESEGTVTSSERRVQRVHKALEPPGEAREDVAIIAELARRLGRDLGIAGPHDAWEECRRLSPWHAGMSYERLERMGGLQWPCYDEQHPGEQFLHGRLWETPIRGPRAPFKAVAYEPPVEALDEHYPIRLTSGRRLESFNTGVQSGAYSNPLRRAEALDISPYDAQRYGLSEGDPVRVVSRRGAVRLPVHIDDGMRAGLAFTTLHFNDEAATNVLTVSATDPQSGTAEFKAAAIRLER